MLPSSSSLPVSPHSSCRQRPCRHQASPGLPLRQCYLISLFTQLLTEVSQRYICHLAQEFHLREMHEEQNPSDAYAFVHLPILSLLPVQAHTLSSSVSNSFQRVTSYTSMNPEMLLCTVDLPPSNIMMNTAICFLGTVSV